MGKRRGEREEWAEEDKPKEDGEDERSGMEEKEKAVSAMDGG